MLGEAGTSEGAGSVVDSSAPAAEEGGPDN